MSEPHLLRDLLSAARAYAREFPIPALGAHDLTIVLMVGVSTDDADADMVDDALMAISTEHVRLPVAVLEEVLNAQERD